MHNIFAMGIGSSIENIDVELGDAVKVIAGPFANSVGVIREINTNKKTVVVKLSIFGRDTSPFSLLTLMAVQKRIFYELPIVLKQWASCLFEIIFTGIY